MGIRVRGGSTVTAVLGAIGDLVEDVVVRLHGTVNIASDTVAEVTRRRGGSAANVVEAACRAGSTARFIGQIGDDATGEWLAAHLRSLGADVTVRRAGRTGTVVVLVHPGGERTMLSDRAACVELRDPDPTWLDGLSVLHVPYYSLTAEPLATTATTLAAWANERGITVSVDASSEALIHADGPDVALARIVAVAPAVVLANELEAAALGERLEPSHLGGATVVVKRGGGPVTIVRDGVPAVEVPAIALDDVRDTTGAGDAFAAGFLIALAAGADAVDATRAGHRVAADAVRRVSA
jgi:sugar/nucleoside kinase (ribokinase family)